MQKEEVRNRMTVEVAGTNLYPEGGRAECKGRGSRSVQLLRRVWKVKAPVVPKAEAEQLTTLLLLPRAAGR